MRTLLAIVILVVGMFTLSAPSDAARKAKRIIKPHHSAQRQAAQPRYSREEPSANVRGPKIPAAITPASRAGHANPSLVVPA